MTRETKIGLFVGMGVIILIGILISDHLSTVAKQQSASLATATEQMQPETQPPLPGTTNPNVTPAIVTTPPGGPTRDLVAPPTVSQLVPPPPVSNDTPVTLNQDVRNFGGNRTGGTVTSRNNPDSGDPLTGPGGQFERIRPDGGVNNTTVTTLIPAPKQTIHFVKEGDSLFAISRQYFGDSNHMQAIYDANKDKMTSIHSLRPGVRLVIPAKKTDAAVSTATPTTTSPTVADPLVGGTTILGPGSNTTAAAPKTNNATLVDYTIKEGETLSTIAEKIYGSKTAWQKLYALNKERVPNPNRMKPGTVISVPRNP